ncbi:MAG: beta-glucosidase, partial [Lachnospiraceae bacterium]|nr:beta-glucosidase [Lachnospiraceae bacterium]
KGYKLEDVRKRKVSLEQFIAQLSPHDLMCMVRGVGLCSPKVTPGTAGAFGGVTQSLRDFGIPLGCCADGPSGIRMDCGTIAFAMPNGTCQACCFNEELVEELYELEALELRKNRIDTLLGPGINIHRNPLNGRNFEYFSEDPLLTGRMVVAQLKGMHKYHVTGTVKHFACNNQEHKRSLAEGIVSERAIREIYLKPFEMCVKEGDAYCIMSTYGPVNGFWTASCYDLLTRILRGEWSYDGVVMTDWWANGNEEGGEGTLSQVSAQVRSQNDLNMVNTDADTNSNGDDLEEGLASGKVTLGELQRTAMNICRVLMRMPAMWHSLGQDDALDMEMKRILSREENASQDMINLEMDENNRLDSSLIPTQKGRQATLCIRRNERGYYKMRFKLRVATKNPLAQLPLSITKDKALLATISLRGDENEWKEFELDLGDVFNPYFYMKFFFGQNGMEISDICCELYRSY